MHRWRLFSTLGSAMSLPSPLGGVGCAREGGVDQGCSPSMFCVLLLGTYFLSLLPC